MLDPYQAAAVMLERAAPPHPFAGLQPAHHCAIAVDPPSYSRNPDEFYARAIDDWPTARNLACRTGGPNPSFGYGLAAVPPLPG
jgi:hypothetical protein